jgi:hypothetical protein
VAEARSPAVVRQEIAVERAELAEAVEVLRQRIADTANVKARIGARASVLAPVALLATFVLFGGIGATMRYLARRGRDRR